MLTTSGLIGDARAGLFRRQVQKPVKAAPVQIAPVQSVQVQSAILPEPIQMAPIQKGPIQMDMAPPVKAYSISHTPQYCVSYRHHPTLKKICCGCCQPIEVVLHVVDPACCTSSVDVTVCVPGCCLDAPTVDGRCGILGRRIVTYQWSNGFKVRAVFNAHNDVVVHSYGR